MKRLLLLALCGCSALDPATESNDPPVYASQTRSAVTFEIVQKPDATTAGWASLAESSSSILASTDRCVVEALDARTPPAAVTGTATFSGANLTQGLVIVGGQAEPRTAAGAWTTGDILTFSSQGFDAPTVSPIQFEVPSTSLKILTDEGSLAISASADFQTHWAPGIASRDDAVVVTLLGASNVELRCSYPRDAIWGPIPKDLIAKLGTKSGTLSFSTRRLQTRGSDNWTIYVVATSVIREQPFTLTP